jgi:hypothetical protein
MEENVGDLESGLRVLVGALFGLASLAILTGRLDAQMLLSPILGGLSIVLLVTGLTCKCRLYGFLGKDTAE